MKPKLGVMLVTALLICACIGSAMAQAGGTGSGKPITTGTPARPSPTPRRTKPKVTSITSPPRMNSCPTTVGGITNKLGMQLEYIVGDTFTMGSTRGDPNERPVHKVTLRNFYIGKCEVTQKEWKQLMPPKDFGHKDCDDCPVENVSWQEVQKFITQLNHVLNDNLTYRLPTEAEWEYACRAGNLDDFPAGANKIAWHSGKQTQRVAMKDPNAWGLHDMYGNVWEWCEDWYHDSYDGAPADGSAWQTGSSEFRVVRGSAYNFDSSWLRPSFRLKSVTPKTQLKTIGFRLAASP
ncbi:MAG TPA: formylglycine-generating enzyme family protein [Pyrinomonadaceae bacterium]|nr:formylglycine-generating enzyme family protein [Pyrinomonadaceae bacterium]